MYGGVFRLPPAPQQATPHTFPGLSVDDPPPQRRGRSVVDDAWRIDPPFQYTHAIAAFPGSSVDRPPLISRALDMERILAAFPLEVRAPRRASLPFALVCDDVMDAGTLGLAQGAAIPASFGTRAGLTVVNRGRATFGAGAIDPSASVFYWAADPPDEYDSLSASMYAAPPASGAIGCGEFEFTPDAGKTVTLNDLRAGGWTQTLPVTYQIRVYDVGTGLLVFNRAAQWTSGAPSETVLIAVSSAVGLRLQWGSTLDNDGDLDAGEMAINDICVSLSDTPPSAADGFWIIRKRRRRG